MKGQERERSGKCNAIQQQLIIFSVRLTPTLWTVPCLDIVSALLAFVRFLTDEISFSNVLGTSEGLLPGLQVISLFHNFAFEFEESFKVQVTIGLVTSF